MGVYTGTVPTFLAGELPDADKFTEISNYMTASTSARTTWSPTLTNLTLGNGTLTARYRQLGKTIDFWFLFVLGSTSAVGTAPKFTLPVNFHSSNAIFDFIGETMLANTGTAHRKGQLLVDAAPPSSSVQIFGYSTTGVVTAVSATFPHTWVSTDRILCYGSYEAA